jgi:hypothetical protein
MPKRARLPRQNRFNGWAAAASVAAACCVLVAYAATYNPPYSAGEHVVPSQAIFMPAGGFSDPTTPSAIDPRPWIERDHGFGGLDEDPLGSQPDSKRSRDDEFERSMRFYRR